MTSRAKRRRVRRPPPGTAPGTIPTTADAPRAVVRVLAYGPEGVEELRNVELAQIPALLKSHAVVWIDVAGTGDADVITRLGELLGLHRLSLEDVVHLDQRPKLEEYGDVLYFVARMLGPEHDAAGEQLSLFLGKGFVATFQEEAADGDCLDPVRERIRQGGPRIRESGAAYLAYAILDSVVDAYFPRLERLGDRLEVVEAQVLECPEPVQLGELHMLRRELLALRRTVWPLRDVLNAVLRDEKDRMDPALHPYWRDCHDHALRVVDLVETYRDVVAGLLELYVSMMSHRLNEVMKVLTLVATIFIPLSFIASIWGMNFDTSHPLNMPELRWKYGYLFALGVMAVAGGGMLLLFRRRRWL